MGCKMRICERRRVTYLVWEQKGAISPILAIGEVLIGGQNLRSHNRHQLASASK